MTALEEYEQHVISRTRWTLQADMVCREKADAAIESLKCCVLCEQCDVDEDGCGSCREMPERNDAGYLANDVDLFDHCQFTPSRWQERTQ
jgi:hypothetical protein